MPPLNDKKLDKLQKLLEIANEDYATPEDLIALSEGILGVITTEKERLDKVIADNKGESQKENQATLKALTEKEQGINYVINKLRSETADRLSKATTSLSKEIKRVERKIPTKTDLTGLEREIDALKEGLNTLPTELTLNNEAIEEFIRDGYTAIKELRQTRGAKKGQLVKSLVSQEGRVYPLDSKGASAYAEYILGILGI